MLTGSFIRAGQYLGDILRTTPDVEQARPIDILGTSTGGRSAIGLASSLGKYVRNLIIFDAPGSRKMSYKNFQHQFGVQEAQHGARYVSGSHDEQFQAIMRAAPSRASIDYMRRFARRDPIAAYDFYVSEIFGMSRGKLLNDLLQSDLSLVRRVVFLSPDRSELNNPEDVAGALKQAQAEHPHTVFEHYLLNGTHVMPRATSTMMSWLTKAAIAPEVFQK